MANTNLAFTIQLKGIDSIDALNKEIKKTNAELKEATVGTQKYADTAERLAKLKAEQKALKKNQTELTKSFLETSNALSAYDKASAKLNRLRKEFKAMAFEGKASTEEGKRLRKEIEKLDGQLKKTDASVGQFQRNVGNYPRIFGLSTKALMQMSPALGRFSKGLDKATGSVNVLGKALTAGFVAFKVIELIMKMVEAFNELSKSINETRNTVGSFTGLVGEELDEVANSVSAVSSTFEVEAEQVSKSAKKLASTMGISFEDALTQIEDNLIQGVESADDYLQRIEEFPETFEKAGAAVTKLAKKNRGLLEANRELAAAQAEVVQKFQGFVSGGEATTKKAQATLFKGLSQLFELLRPLRLAFEDLQKAYTKLFKSFSTGAKEGKKSNLIFKSLNSIVKVLFAVIQTGVKGVQKFVEVLGFLTKSAFSLTTRFESVGRAVKVVTGFFGAVVKALQELPFYFEGLSAVITKFVTDFKNFSATIALDTQILAARVKATFSRAAKERLAELRAQRKELAKVSGGLGEVFADAFNAAKKKQEERIAAQIQAEKDAIAEAEAKRKAKADAEKLKVEKAEAKKRFDALLKERQRFLAEESKFVEAQTKILLALREKEKQLFIDSIADQQVKERRQAKEAFEDRLEALNDQLAQLRKLGAEREAEAIKLFGKDSKQAKELALKNAEDIAKAEEEAESIRLRERLAYTNELLAIDENYRQQQAAQQQAAFEEQLEQNRTNEETQLLLLEQNLNNGIILEKEYNDEVLRLRQETLNKELELIKKRQEALQASGIEMTEEEKKINKDLELQKTRIYTELSGITKQFNDAEVAATKAAEEEKKKLYKKGLDDFKERFEIAAQIFQTSLNLIGDLQKAADERRLKQIEKTEELNQQQNDALKERLQRATGLEKQFLQQQIAANEKAAKETAKKKEEIEKAQAKREKARAITQSIINTLLAVTKLLDRPLAATAAGIAGAAATATIAAQPLAKGGLVGSLEDEIVHFAGGGKIKHKGNIKPLSNGDNILATVKTGEVVLNKRQQSLLGGAKTFKAIGVPGFAEGGRVGAPTSIASSVLETNAQSERRLQLLEEGIKAQANRVDNIRVIWDAQTQDDSEKGLREREQIRINTEF